MIKKIIIILCFFYANYCFASEENIVKIVEVETAKAGNIADVATLIGTIKSNKISRLTAKSDGILGKIFSTSGSYVKKDDIIATLKSYELEAEAEAIAKNQMQRMEKLFNTNVNSRYAYEEKRKEWIKHQHEIDKYVFRAPFDGVVGIFKSNSGEDIKSGQELVSIYSMESIYADFEVPEDILKKIKPGQKIIIDNQILRLDELQYILDSEIYMAPAKVFFKCNKCIIGSLINLDLVIEEHENVIIIPFEAIFMKKSKPYVYVVVDGKVKEQEIVMGIREKEQIEIKQGIKLGDQVVLRGQSRLSEGANVEIYNQKTIK